MQKQAFSLPAVEYQNFDVVVCGAGPAGIGAALAAAREGARVLLLERLFCVGGIGSTYPVNTWCDSPGGPLFDEMEKRIEALGKARRHYNPDAHTCRLGRVHIHNETLKAVALSMLLEAGVQVMFGATACGASLDGDTVSGVFAARKGELIRIPARIVIDTSADADIAAAAGAGFLKGDPADGRVMHANFRFQMAGISADAPQPPALPEPEKLISLLRQAHADGSLKAPQGVFSPQAELFPYHSERQALQVNSWELDGVDCANADSVSAAVADCQLRALEVVEFCRGHIPGYENCGIGRIWDVLGTRESRRIRGSYMLSGDDVISGRKFTDGIAKACFFIDFHDSPPGHTLPYAQEFRVAHAPALDDWYEIPYRCLLPENRCGLLVAGRCISATREGLASMRIMPTCMYVGQAAGTAAAQAVAENIQLTAVDVQTLRAKLGF